jgi:hypothetical protein
MSDEELLQAVKEEKAAAQSPEVGDDMVDNDPVDEDEEFTDDDGEVIDDDEVEEDDPEQLDDDQDSAESDDDHDSETEEDEDAPEKDNADESDDGVTKDSKAEGEEAEPEKKVYKFKANGQEFEFTQDEVINQFGKVFGQAMNYTKKMQAIAPYRKMISAMEEEGITQDDMNLMIDVLKGNKDAIATVIKKANIDVLDLDLDEDKNYVPNSYGRDERELQIQEVIDEISHDREFAITQHVVAEQWDDTSREAFAENPQLIKELHIDVVNGVYDKVAPMAMKLKVLDGGKRSDLEYYIEAGRQYHMQSRAAEVEEKTRLEQEQQKLKEIQQAQQKRASTKQAAPKRKAATIPRKRSGTPKVTDYLDDSDEAFEEWYRKLQESM